MGERQFAVFGNGAEKKFVDALLSQRDAITCTYVPPTSMLGIDINASASAVPSHPRAAVAPATLQKRSCTGLWDSIYRGTKSGNIEVSVCERLAMGY
jgi:hypothetical protein